MEQKQSVRVVHGGNNQGVYACWELVYAYAMWISGEFFLKVISAEYARFLQWLIVDDIHGTVPFGCVTRLKNTARQ